MKIVVKAGFAHLLVSTLVVALLQAFTKYQATEALLHVLQGEKDVALRDCAHRSLQLATGKDLPPDAKQWEAFLRQANTPNLAANPPKPPKLFGIF